LKGSGTQFIVTTNRICALVAVITLAIESVITLAVIFRSDIDIWDDCNADLNSETFFEQCYIHDRQTKRLFTQFIVTAGFCTPVNGLPANPPTATD
jgi:hypothetical protein